MSTVVCFGEALIDFIAINSVDEETLSLNEYRQYPGGAPANVAVAIAKLGGNASFAGQIGSDNFGDFLVSALSQYQVNTQFILRHPTAKTALAFVSLDDDGERSFSFYRDNTADLVMIPPQISSSWFDAGDIAHFCSNTLTDKGICETTQRFIDTARSQDALVSFDVNLRHNLWRHGHANIETVNEFTRQSDLLKFSRDELEYLAQGDVEQYIQSLIYNGVLLILVTNGAGEIAFYGDGYQGTLPTPKVDALDTTAAGDAFIGGFLCALSQQQNPVEFLEHGEQLSAVIDYAARCGAHAVSRYGAFPALPSVSDIGPLSM
ncbi:carbohydrate kinase [Psychrobium sp. MM17-31]|uniref:carbohydrate kinase family protein n=1 Tax=Psychrobium sp. MM17-31 TaxID=2917758 RepID=UPI001EF6E145|nr:carbohydrate kinase [Psychrobium sp. MM17-31]MCG7532126.1 carbohydrate kinase [Psychrobium sp. MM17-31]